MYKSGFLVNFLLYNSFKVKVREVSVLQLKKLSIYSEYTLLGGDFVGHVTYHQPRARPGSRLDYSRPPFSILILVFILFSCHKRTIPWTLS